MPSLLARARRSQSLRLTFDILKERRRRAKVIAGPRDRAHFEFHRLVLRSFEPRRTHPVVGANPIFILSFGDEAEPIEIGSLTNIGWNRPSQFSFNVSD